MRPNLKSPRGIIHRARMLSGIRLAFKILFATAFCGTSSHLLAATSFEVTPARLFILSVGINVYPPGGKLPNIKFGEADASAIADVLTLPNKLAFDAIIPKRLLGKDATSDGIRGAMQSIAGIAHPDDMFLFYFGGMGVCGPQFSQGEYLFGASDTLVTEDNSGGRVEHPLRTSELAALILQIPAKWDFLILDTCASQRAATSIRNALEPKDSFSLGILGRQVAIFTTETNSLESERLGHGLLTYCLLEGLAGAADADRSGIITEARLRGYLTWRLPEIAEQEATGQERLFAYSNMQNLVLRSTRPKAHALRAGDTAVESLLDIPIPGAPKDLGQDYALIVGTDHYADWPALANAAFDAQSLRDVLVSDYEYKPRNITLLKDASKRSVIDAITALVTSGRTFGRNDRLLVYFAGHGTTSSIDGYLAFSDSLSPARDPLHDSLLSYATLRDALSNIQVPHILLLLDVCYGGTFASKTRFQSLIGEKDEDEAPREDLIDRAMKSPSRIYITSGDEGRKVSDGIPGQHSPFSKRLLATLGEHGGAEHLLDVATLYSSLRSLPLEPRAGFFDSSATSLNADFLFIPKP